MATLAVIAGSLATAAEEAPTPAAAGATAPVKSPIALDTPAQVYFKQIKPAPVSATTNQLRNLTMPQLDTITKLKKLSIANAGAVQRLDEIRVYSYVQPEDFMTPEKNPLMQMRDRLDRLRRPTPADQVHTALCMLGFCGGIPEEISAENRASDRARNAAVDGTNAGPLQ